MTGRWRRSPAGKEVMQPRLWVSLKIVEEATGVSIKALYQQIRKGTFPFRYRRAGRSILVSARDLGLLDTPEAKATDQSTQPSQSRRGEKAAWPPTTWRYLEKGENQHD